MKKNLNFYRSLIAFVTVLMLVLSSHQALAQAVPVAPVAPIAPVPPLPLLLLFQSYRDQS